MPDVLDLTDELLISQETPESIKARLLADTNAGVDPSDPAYADTVPGSIWDDLNGAVTLEFDRIYDRLNEVVAAAIPATSFGGFLDTWARSVGLDGRKPAARAGGIETFTGTDGTEIAAGTQVSTAQTSADTEPITFQTTVSVVIASGTAPVEVVALNAGSEGNVPANTVTIVDTPIIDVAGVSVTNAAAMTGGADVETDEKLLGRIIRKLSGAGGGGNADDYINWALNYPGVGFVTVRPNTPSIGHVLVLIADENNDPMPSAAIAGLQAQLDPSSSSTQGAGLAAIGATVEVDTPVPTAVAINATVALRTGYSIDGAGGTEALRAAIETALSAYIDRLPAGADVTYNKVLAAIIDVAGVDDVTVLQINAAAATLAIAADHVAALTRPTTLAAA